MRKVVIGLMAFALVFVLCGGAGAQDYPENHYLVYQLNNEYPVDITVTLFDQFDQFFPPPGFTTNNLVMDKFANPVIKNGEDYYNQAIHQTWWRIFDPQLVKEVGFVNQFGAHTWFVGDALYLVLPALKNEPGGDIPAWNHYKCYDAVGPLVDQQVSLTDQWGGPYTTVAAYPIMFCNPCIKDVLGGERYEIVETLPHLAVYQLEPAIFSQNFALATDQFGAWDIDTLEAIWLVVPSEKLTVIDSETKSWGSIKSLYR